MSPADSSPEHRLEDYLDRVLCDVCVPARRRRRMREELLAHLWAAFEEQLASHGDPEQAVSEALRRFGDANDLALALRHSQRRRIRLIAWFRGSHDQQNPCNWSGPMRKSFSILGVVGMIVGLGFVFPQLANLRMHGHLVAIDVALLLAGLTVSAAGCYSLARGIRLKRA